MQTEVPFSFLFIGGAGDRATPSEQSNCCNVAVITAIQGPIIHIKQGEASLSSACLRLYAFEKSFPQAVRTALIPTWRAALPPPGAFTSFQARACLSTNTNPNLQVGAPRTLLTSVLRHLSS